MSITNIDTPVEQMSGEELRGFEELAELFCRKSLEPIFESESSDGDLSRIPEVFEKALEAGLAAAPDPDMPGYDYGIWANVKQNRNILPSTVLLAKIAETCGGVASLIHWQGLASNLMSGVLERLNESSLLEQIRTERIAVCLMEESGLPFLGTLLQPDLEAPVQCEAFPDGDNFILNGTKSFVYSPGEISHCLVFARLKNEWGIFPVALDAEGVHVNEIQHRTGLRACKLQHIDFFNVSVSGHNVLLGNAAATLLRETLTLNWIGLSAMACGVAREGLRKARTYASERYQGGTLIENHPIIKLLLADSEADLETAWALTSSLSGIDLGSIAGLKQAAIAKLKSAELCARAATNSLQVFGGYGFMEDFGMEKRLRDVSVIKSSYGSPTYLKQFIHDCNLQLENRGRTL